MISPSEKVVLEMEYPSIVPVTNVPLVNLMVSAVLFSMVTLFMSVAVIVPWLYVLLVISDASTVLSSTATEVNVESVIFPSVTVTVLRSVLVIVPLVKAVISTVPLAYVDPTISTPVTFVPSIVPPV